MAYQADTVFTDTNHNSNVWVSLFSVSWISRWGYKYLRRFAKGHLEAMNMVRLAKPIWHVYKIWR